MDEREFWKRLEFRICSELQGFADERLRYYWCDGLIPDEYDFSTAQPQIRGRAWCGGSGQEHWRFTLLLPPETSSLEMVEWLALLPADERTGWLSPDRQGKTMTIDPSDGHPE